MDNELGALAPHQCRQVDVVWTARCRDADREKGRASWRQVGLPAQSLPRRRFRRACVRAYIQFVCVCAYMCMCVCVRTCVYIYMCMCVCTYTHVYVYVYAYLYIDCGSWYQYFSVWTCMRMCFRVHVHAYTYVCRYIYMYILFCSECYLHLTGVVDTSTWAGVYVTQVCFYTNVHICEHIRCRLCTYVYMYISVYMHVYAYGCVCASMILLDTLKRCC